MVPASGIEQTDRRERIACETWGGSPPVVYDPPTIVSELGERLGFHVIAAEGQAVFDQWVFWIEWRADADMSVRFNEPVKRIGWR